MHTSEESVPVRTPDTQSGGSVVAEPLVDQHQDEAQVHLPPTTIWPITTAFGVSIAGLGLVTSYVFSFAGILIMIWGVFSWVQELRHEPH